MTTAMLRHMVASRGNDQDSVPYALTDFQILGCYAGLRLGEYAQYKRNEVTMVANGALPKAFIMDDFVFYGPEHSHLPQPPSRELPTELVHSATLRFREQKNGDNGQRVIFSTTPNDPDLCPVQAMLRIRSRAQRLHIKQDSPLAAASHHGKVILLHEQLINAHI